MVNPPVPTSAEPILLCDEDDLADANDEQKIVGAPDVLTLRARLIRDWRTLRHALTVSRAAEQKALFDAHTFELAYEAMAEKIALFRESAETARAENARLTAENERLRALNPDGFQITPRRVWPVVCETINIPAPTGAGAPEEQNDA